jgi:hypothetical protein
VHIRVDLLVLESDVDRERDREDGQEEAEGEEPPLA